MGLVRLRWRNGSHHPFAYHTDGSREKDTLGKMYVGPSLYNSHSKNCLLYTALSAVFHIDILHSMKNVTRMQMLTMYLWYLVNRVLKTKGPHLSIIKLSWVIDSTGQGRLLPEDDYLLMKTVLGPPEAIQPADTAALAAASFEDSKMQLSSFQLSADAKSGLKGGQWSLHISGLPSCYHGLVATNPWPKLI